LRNLVTTNNKERKTGKTDLKEPAHSEDIQYRLFGVALRCECIKGQSSLLTKSPNIRTHPIYLSLF